MHVNLWSIALGFLTPQRRLNYHKILPLRKRFWIHPSSQLPPYMPMLDSSTALALWDFRAKEHRAGMPTASAGWEAGWASQLSPTGRQRESPEKRGSRWRITSIGLACGQIHEPFS